MISIEEERKQNLKDELEQWLSDIDSNLTGAIDEIECDLEHMKEAQEYFEGLDCDDVTLLAEQWSSRKVDTLIDDLNNLNSGENRDVEDAQEQMAHVVSLMIELLETEWVHIRNPLNDTMTLCNRQIKNVPKGHVWNSNAELVNCEECQTAWRKLQIAVEAEGTE